MSEKLPALKEILSAWNGQPCTSLDKYEHTLHLQFGDKGGVNIECTWRVVTKGGIIVAGDDDGHLFGLPKPVDAQELARRHLIGKVVCDAAVREGTGDLSIAFGDATLELFNCSSGYEAWNANFLLSGAKFEIVAQGGGNLEILRSD